MSSDYDPRDVPYVAPPNPDQKEAYFRKNRNNSDFMLVKLVGIAAVPVPFTPISITIGNVVTQSMLNKLIEGQSSLYNKIKITVSLD